MTTYVSAPLTFTLQENTPAGEANWKLCIQGIHDALIGCGLVDTNDTGATDLSTVTRGSTSGQVRATRMYRFNDSRQGVDPVFIKVEYANGNNVGNMPAVYFTVGQGTNGSLTLTGQTSSRYLCGNNSINVNYTGAATTYACHTEGYFGIFGRRIASGTNMGGGSKLYECFTVTRTRDAAYAFDGIGVMVTADNDYSAKCFSNQFVRFAAPAATSLSTTQGALIVGHPSSSALLNGDKQLYPHFFYDPGYKIHQSWSTFTIVQADFAANPTTFTATPVVAGGPRTFIFLGNDFAQWGDPNGSSAYRIATLWE